MQWRFGNDLWMGRFEDPISPQQVSYPIYTTEDEQDLIGVELFIFGRSAAHPQFSGIPGVNLRAGRNVISSLLLASDFDNDSVVDDNSNFRFDFGHSTADITGPDGVGDGVADGLDLLLLAMNDYLDNPSLIAGYFDGDLDDAGSSFQRVDSEDFGLLLSEAGSTGGLGWDEACTRGGDSSGPSFTFVDDQPALIGTHYRVGQDAYAGFDPAEITSAISQASGGMERPCFVSFSRKYVLGESAWRRGGALESHVGKQRVFGDVTGDYRLDSNDILAMEAEIRAHQDAMFAGQSYPYNWGFDLNSDGDINLDDFQVLMTEGFKTNPADVVANNGAFGPDGRTSVLGEGFLIFGNIGMVNATLADGDLNLDGKVDVLGDAFLLVEYLGQNQLLRLDLDFDKSGASNGVLDAADIDALIAQFSINTNAYNAAFDLTTSRVDTDGTVTSDDEMFGIADGVVDRGDLIFYLEAVLGTGFGDVNLDGTINIFGDGFILVNGNGSGWAGGDLNFDGVVNQDDLTILGQLLN